MRTFMSRLSFALAAILLFTATLTALEPRREGGRGGGGGRESGGSIERFVDSLKLSKTQQETVREAIRSYQGTIRRLSDKAETTLITKLKEVLTADEFTKLQAAAQRRIARPAGGNVVTTGNVVDRLLSFDTDKDGKVAKDELPERMQNLLERGDSNKDGSLDKQEIQALGASPSSENAPRGRGGEGGREMRVGGAEGTGFSFDQIEQALEELKLPEARKEVVATAIKASRNNARTQTQKTRAGLLEQVKPILPTCDLSRFRTTLERGQEIGEQPRRSAERGRNAADRR